jgi:hypothetical protein
VVVKQRTPATFAETTRGPKAPKASSKGVGQPRPEGTTTRGRPAARAFKEKTNLRHRGVNRFLQTPWQEQQRVCPCVAAATSEVDPCLHTRRARAAARSHPFPNLDRLRARFSSRPAPASIHPSNRSTGVFCVILTD